MPREEPVTSTALSVMSALSMVFSSLRAVRSSGLRVIR
jgi:hypothetical protein